MPIKRVMGSDHKWMEQFGISPSDIAQWKTNAEALQALLLENKLPESEYLKWASTHFELPVVKNEFFAISPDLVFWDHVKSLHAWSWSLFPLYEWDGVMLVACVIPPEDLKLKSAHRLVLASAKDMKAFWAKLNPNAQASLTPAASATIAPKDEPMEQTQTKTSSIPRRRRGKPIDESASIGSQTAANHQTAPQSPPKPKASDFEALEAQFGLSKIYSENQLPQDTESDLLLSGPEGLTFTGIKIGGPKIDFAKSDFPDNKRHSEPAGFDSSSETRISSNFDFAGTLEPQKSSVINDDEVQSFTVTNFNFEPSKDEEASPKEFTQTGKPPVRPLECSITIDELGDLAVQHVEKIFSGSILFLYQNEKLVPWKWNQSLTSDANANLSVIDLTTPSIFRITFSSKQPYHGYVMPSPVNNEFFAAFNEGKIPAHVTIVPIIWEKQLLGMIMGLSEMKLDYTSSLADMQDIAKELAQHITRIRESIAA